MVIKHNFTIHTAICIIVLFLYCLYQAIFFGTYPITDSNAVQSPGTLMYAGENKNLISRCYGIKTEDVPDVTSDFVLIDADYNFNGQENFEKIATYGIPVVFASRDFVASKDLDVSEVIIGQARESAWSEIGVKNVGLGDINIAVPFDKQLISNSIAKWTGPSTERAFESNATYGKTKPELLYIMFESNLLVLTDYKVVKSNIPNDILKFDLYQNKSFESTSKPELKHMYEINSDEYRNIQDFENIQYRSENPFNGWMLLSILFAAIGVAFLIVFGFEKFGEN